MGTRQVFKIAGAALFAISFASPATETLPKPATYHFGSEASLKIAKASSAGLQFEIEGVNEYNGSECGADGLAKPQGPAKWAYQGRDGCRVVLTLVDPDKIKVAEAEASCHDCGHGATLSDGDYRTLPVDCRERERLSLLIKQKKSKEAYELARKLEGRCDVDQSENQLGAFYSDLAFLAFQSGDKAACLKYVKNGLDSMLGSDGGLKRLEESRDFYAHDGEPDEKGHSKRICYGQEPGGCTIYSERIKIFKWLEHNRTLCR